MNHSHCSVYVTLCILYLKSTYKNSLWKTSKYRLIDATLTSGNQIRFFFVVVVILAVVKTYSDEV